MRTQVTGKDTISVTAHDTRNLFGVTASTSHLLASKTDIERRRELVAAIGTSLPLAVGSVATRQTGTKPA